MILTNFDGYNFKIYYFKVANDILPIYPKSVPQSLNTRAKNCKIFMRFSIVDKPAVLEANKVLP